MSVLHEHPGEGANCQTEQSRAKQSRAEHARTDMDTHIRMTQRLNHIHQQEISISFMDIPFKVSSNLPFSSSFSRVFTPPPQFLH